MTIDENHVYDADLLRTAHNHEFMNEPAHQRAYLRGVQATGLDYGWHWRFHVGLWAARTAAKLAGDGDFVECGVAKGFLASGIMHDLDWNKTGKTFYLCDTFAGTDLRYVSPVELAEGAEAKDQHLKNIGLYPDSPVEVFKNFAEWEPHVKFVVGPIPETLSLIDPKTIAFLHIDMNCSPPEVAAMEHLWDRLVPGALILFDDYAYHGYRQQKLGMDAWARTKDMHVLSLPTGQGLLIKPPEASP